MEEEGATYGHICEDCGSRNVRKKVKGDDFEIPVLHSNGIVKRYKLVRESVSCDRKEDAHTLGFYIAELEVDLDKAKHNENRDSGKHGPWCAQKFRCSEARVLRFLSILTHETVSPPPDALIMGAGSARFSVVNYKQGKIVRPVGKPYEDSDKVCAPGIHYFIVPEACYRLVGTPFWKLGYTGWWLEASGKAFKYKNGNVVGEDDLLARKLIG